MELNVNHEPSLNHWARRLADDDIRTGYHKSWDHAYECAWNAIEQNPDLFNCDFCGEEG